MCVCREAVGWIKIKLRKTPTKNQQLLNLKKKKIEKFEDAENWNKNQKLIEENWRQCNNNQWVER